MEVTWITSNPNTTVFESQTDLSHFTDNSHYDPQHSSLHSLRHPTTNQWIPCKTDEECLQTMRDLYTEMVKPMIPTTTHGGYFGVGLSHCPYSQNAKRILEQKNSIYSDLPHRIPNYHGTYPLVFWCGSPHEPTQYIGGCSELIQQLKSKKHHIKELLHYLRQYIHHHHHHNHHHMEDDPFENGRFITAIQGRHVRNRDIRHFLRHSPHVIIRSAETPTAIKHWNQLSTEYNLPPQWFIDLHSPQPKVLPLEQITNQSKTKPLV